MKLTKKLYSGTTLTGSKNYVNGIEYNGANLEAIYHADGRLLPNGAAWHYDYTLKDHLGNARVTFRASGSTWANVEEMHYYPFGMQMENAGTANPTNKYLYNGKERNEDFGLNWCDYGKRWYDVSIARFPSVDPIIEKLPYLTPYNYASNDPVGKIDLYGLQGIRYFQDFYQSLATQILGKINELKEAMTPSPEAQNRIELGANGVKNIGMGVLATAGVAAAAPETGGATGVLLPLTLGEVAMGFAQTCDACLGENPDPNSPLHKSGTIAGAAAYSNDSPYAETIDATAQFVPGISTGGNIFGMATNTIGAVKGVKAGKAMETITSAANAYDAFSDTRGVWNAADNFNPSAKRQNAQKIQQNDTSNTSGVLQKIDVQYSTKDVNEIKAFIENLNK